MVSFSGGGNQSTRRKQQPCHKSLTNFISHNITNLVCYTYFHWFFNPECQHLFGKQTGYIFQSPKTIKTWTTKHYASLNQWNNKCIFTKLNAVYILTTVNSVTNTWSIQQTPTFHGCAITNKQNIEPWKFSTSWGHTKVLFTCC